jgi:probable phosphoglycerate mutase
VLLRHGETSWNLQGYYQGQEDVPLNEQGQKQASAVAAALQQDQVDAIVASPLKRALDTASAVWKKGHKADVPEIVHDPRLMEMHLGSIQGLHRDDPQCQEFFEERSKAVDRNDYSLKAPGPGGESLQDVRRRTRAALEDAAKLGDRVLVVCHGGIINHAVCDILGDDHPVRPIQNCSLTELVYDLKTRSFTVGSIGEVRIAEKMLDKDEGI